MINTKNLSVGILLDTTSVCNWEYELISRLKSLDFIDLKVVVLNGIYEKNSNNLLKKIYNKVFSLTLTKIARVMFNYLDMHSPLWRFVWWHCQIITRVGRSLRTPSKN